MPLPLSPLVRDPPSSLKAARVEIHDYVSVLRRGWLLLLLLAVLGALVGFSLAIVQPPKYSAVAKAYVSTQAATSIGDLSQGTAFTQQVITSYADIATTASVLDRVGSDLRLTMPRAKLAKEITVVPATNETVLTISVSDESPTRAAAIANSVSRNLSLTVDALTPRAVGTKAPISIAQIDPAVANPIPDSPKPMLYAVFGAVGGLLLAFLFSVIRELTDTRVRDVDDVARVTDAPVIGTTERRGRGPAAPQLPRELRLARMEAYRSLRNNLQFMELGATKRSLVVTSSISAEGKSTSVASLGLALADVGERVVLVDADLRRPTLAAQFGLDGAVGLSDVLIGRVSLDAALQTWGDDELTILPGGEVPPNPNELLQTDAMTALMATLSERFDTVLFDAPPLLPVSDAALLARRTNGAIVIAAAGEVRRGQLDEALVVLERAKARVLGLVLTKVSRRSTSVYTYDADPGRRRRPEKRRRDPLRSTAPSTSFEGLS